MTADVELLPCPFCGHVPQDWPDFLHPTGGGWRDDPLGDGTMFRHYMRADDPRGVHGKCWELGCLTHEGGCGATVVGDSRDEAIAAWNARHATAAKDAEIEALRAERDSAQENEAIEYALRGAAEARAERLAEALRLYMSAGFGNSTDFYKQAEAKRAATGALHPTAAQENDDA